MAETSYIIQNGRRLNLKDVTARNSIGSCSELQTEAKHSLVGAVNELCQKISEGGGGSGSPPAGYVFFEITEDGYLQCIYTGDEQPNYSINSEGYLVLEI